jgi:phosphatidate cytidylyltransferase
MKRTYNVGLPLTMTGVAITMKTIQVRVLVATLASLLTPLGELFASAVKRFLGLKQFGSIIPGHGGVIDRINC